MNGLISMRYYGKGSAMRLSPAHTMRPHRQSAFKTERRHEAASPAIRRAANGIMRGAMPCR